MNGFIKLSRSLLKWEWHDDPNMVALWVYILMRANWEDTKWHGIDIPKGSFITSLNALSEDTGISVKSIRTCLKKLTQTGEICTKTANKFTQISVRNWEKFQCLNEQKGKQVASNGQTTDKQRATDEEYKKNKKNKNIYSPSYDSSSNAEVDTSILERYLSESEIVERSN